MVDINRKSFNISGVGYIKSIKDMARLVNRSEGVIRYKLALGASDNQIYSNKDIRKCLFEGKYVAIKDLIEKYGIPYQRFRYLLSKGATVRQALNIDELGKGFKKNNFGTPIEVNGVKYKSIKKAYDVYKDKIDISYNVVKQRYMKYEWTGDEAFFIGKNVKLNYLKRKNKM